MNGPALGCTDRSNSLVADQFSLKRIRCACVTPESDRSRRHIGGRGVECCGPPISQDDEQRCQRQQLHTLGQTRLTQLTHGIGFTSCTFVCVRGCEHHAGRKRATSASAGIRSTAKKTTTKHKAHKRGCAHCPHQAMIGHGQHLSVCYTLDRE